MPAAVTYTFTNTEVADATKINKNYDDLVDAINDFDGGTASDTQRLALPKAGTSTLNALTRKEALIFYDTDEGKIKVDDGVNLKAVGGGLVPVAIDEDYAVDLETGKHYLLDMYGTADDKTLYLPEGASEYNIKVTVINIPDTYKVIISAATGEKIQYNDTDHDTVEFVYAETEQWAEFIWNGTKWLVNDNSNVLSGTFSGSLDFTGTVKVDTIQPHTTSGNITHDGFTALGSGNTGIKCQVLSGTTSSSDGGLTYISHSIGDVSKIIAVKGLCHYTTGATVSDSHMADAGYAFNLQPTDSNITVHLVAGNSSAITSKTVTCIVWYIA